MKGKSYCKQVFQVFKLNLTLIPSTEMLFYYLVAITEMLYAIHFRI